MNALFVHSTRLLRTPDGSVYSRGVFPYRIWSRYLKHFDRLTVVMRMAEVSDAPDRWDLSSGPGVTFAGVPDDHGNLVQQLQSGSTKAVLRQELDECDAVIVRQSRLGWLAAREAQRRGIPWAVEVVGDTWDGLWNYGSLAAKLYAPFAWWQARSWIGRAPFAIYVTRDYLQRQYPCRGIRETASNVEIRQVGDAVLKDRMTLLRRDGHRGVMTLCCGLIGSLSTRYKGLQVALRAMQRLRKQGTNIRLYVLGEGNLDAWRREAAQRGVADLLQLDGLLPSGEPVVRWLDNLGFYIQPSFQEGLPRALIEAMSRGLPALGSTCGGIPELLPPECLHRPGDDRKLAEDMARMARDVEWRRALAQRNFAEAQKYYSDKVEARRDAFWDAFARQCKAQRASPLRRTIA